MWSGAQAEIAQVDSTSPQHMGVILRGATFAINAVQLTEPALSDEYYDSVNVGATTGLLDAAIEADLQGCIHLSSTLPYGDALAPWPVNESRAFHPSSSVAQSLAMAERAARTYRRRLPLVVLRVALPFGPRDRGPVARLLKHALRVSRLRLAGDGRTPVSLTYAPDLARAVWAALEQMEETQNGIFHTKSIDTNWRTIVRETGALRQREIRTLGVPYQVARMLMQCGAVGDWAVQPPEGVERYVELTGRPHLIDDSHLRAITGYAPLFGLRAALRQTLAWMGELPTDAPTG